MENMEQKFCFEFEPTKHSIGTASEIGRFYVKLYSLRVEPLENDNPFVEAPKKFGIFDNKDNLLYTDVFEDGDSFYERFFFKHITPLEYEKISVINNDPDDPHGVKAMLKDKALLKAIREDKELKYYNKKHPTSFITEFLKLYFNTVMFCQTKLTEVF